jgi:hypothetical protein
MFASIKCRRMSRRESRRGVIRRSVVAAALVAYVLVAAGVPLPSISRPTKSGEQFPCASSGCGCGSAEQCWRGCCCHTLAERLDWAQKHGVKPPAFALAAAKRAGLDAGGQPISPKIVRVALAAKSAAKTPTCCQKQASPSCCKSSSERSCCSSRRVDVAKSDESNFVVGFRALACHGQSHNWLAAVPTLVSIELDLADEFPLVAWLGPHSSDIASPFSDTPTPPPPERV